MLREGVERVLLEDHARDGALLPAYGDYCFANVPDTLLSLSGFPADRPLPDGVLSGVERDAERVVWSTYRPSDPHPPSRPSARRPTTALAVVSTHHRSDRSARFACHEGYSVVRENKVAVTMDTQIPTPRRTRFDSVARVVTVGEYLHARAFCKD